MVISRRILSSVAAIGVGCAIGAAIYCYRKFTAEINEVMVFCKLQFNAYNYFDKLISYVEAAQKNISVCMPSIHNPAIQGRLVALLKNKKIKIRIIIDQEGYNESTDFLLKELIDAGAEIKYKTIEPVYKMQHKFCLVDDKILMTGTLDWGNDRAANHWNYVYITNKHELVVPVKREFYQIWGQFSNELELVKKPPCSVCLDNVRLDKVHLNNNIRTDTHLDNGQTVTHHDSVCLDSDTETVDIINSETTVCQTVLDDQNQRETAMTPELIIM